MKATAFIRKSASKNDTNSVATIYFRLRDGKKDIKAASELTINPNHWSSEKQGYKDRVALVHEEKKLALNNEVQNIINLISQEYTPEADSEWGKTKKTLCGDTENSVTACRCISVQYGGGTKTLQCGNKK